MDQGQDMQFYFIQDDYRVTPQADAEPRPALRVRDAAAREGQHARQLRSRRPGRWCSRRTADIFERALIHPDRNNFAPRVGLRLLAGDRDGWCAAPTASSTRTPSGRGAKGCSASIRRTWWTICCRHPSRGAAAVASAAPFRLQNGYPAGLLDPNTLAPTVRRRAQDPNQRTPYIQQYNFGVQHELTPDVMLDVAYVGNKGTQAARLPQSESARGHPERERIASGRRAALSGVRRHPVDGESRRVRLQLAAGARSRSGSREA